MRTLRLLALATSILLVASAMAIQTFTQSFPNNGTVTINGGVGVLKMLCATLVDETPNPATVTGVINYDCGTPPGPGPAFSPGQPALIAANNTFTATPVFSITVSNPCSTCSVGLSLVDLNSQNPGFFLNSLSLTSGVPVTFHYLASGPGHNYYDYRLSYQGYVNGTTITLSSITWG